jgi:hypothetical protein
MRHYRAGEKPCEPCARAHNIAHLKENTTQRVRRIK